MTDTDTATADPATPPAGQDRPADEPSRAPPPPPPPSPPARARGTFLPLAAGGALAAVAGFVVAQGVPDGWPMARTDALAATQEAQAAEIAGLRAAIDSQAATIADLTAARDALAAQLASLPAPATAEPVDLGPLTDRLSALEGQIASIAALPADGDGATSAALAAGLADLRARIDALPAATAPVDSAALDAAVAEAAAAAAALRRQAAIDRVAAALQTGAPYAALLPALGEVSPDLSAPAAAGVASETDLLAAFPDAARAALAVAAAEAAQAGGWGDRALAFLQMQTGARSVTARDGTGPDAVLSRAEAALRGGDLEGAVAEVASLPEVAQPAMADWLAAAQATLRARAALSALQGG